MAQIKSSGNRSTEKILAAVFHTHGITGWRRSYPLFGKPDFVFPSQRVAVFVDGCFWHGHPRNCRIPMTNRAYWQKKIAHNITRDRIVNGTLKKKGWKVIRIWENSVEKPKTTIPSCQERQMQVSSHRENILVLSVAKLPACSCSLHFIDF